jgi:hypothetical protein
MALAQIKVTTVKRGKKTVHLYNKNDDCFNKKTCHVHRKMTEIRNYCFICIKASTNNINS